MEVFSYNYFKTLKRPNVYLAFPNEKQIGCLHVNDFQTDIMGNSPNKGSFKVYRYKDKKEVANYNLIQIGMYLYIDSLKWFVIKEIERQNDGYNEYLNVTYISLEYALGQTILTSFGSLGVETDEQGGLDRYCLYNPLDAEHSIMNIVIQKNPAWSIAYIDPDISTEYRNFQVESIDTYSFLTVDVSKTYECIFQFNSETKEISAYKLENIGKDTNITLGYRNFVKSINQKADDSNVKTVLTVSGGNDARTNTPLGIIDVNISGTNQIYDFSYYINMMSPELRDKLSAYEKKSSDNTIAYQSQLTKLGLLYREYCNLMNRAPDVDGSTDWTKYGLTELQSQEQIYWGNMSLFVSTKDKDETALNQYNANKAIHDAIEKEMGVRKKQVSAKESEVTNCKTKINSLVVRINEFLGDNLYKELSLYVKEDTFTDDSFIATTIMTDSEILEMQQTLLSHAKNELAKVCNPKFNTEIDLINFTVNYDYKKFTDQLDMFNIIHIRFEEQDILTDARLLKLHINWDNPDDFKATFSNRNSLDETFGLLNEIIDQTESNSSSLSYGVGAWANAANVSPEIREYMGSVLDASKQTLQSSKNQEVRIDKTGMLMRKWDESNDKYDPGQLWATNGMLGMTRDGWDTVSLALGYTKVNNQYFYGLCAESIVGKLVLASNLYVSNESGTYTMDNNGLTAKNGNYLVKINPNTPSDIFCVSINNKKLLYVDADNKKLKFEGDIESFSGHIAKFAIANNSLTSGGVGLCSDTSAGAISLWLGNSNKNIAPFRVTNRGKVVCSDIEITGGSMNFTGSGGNCGVGADGILKANGAILSGKITAISGKLGGFEIVGNDLSVISGNARIDFGKVIIDGSGLELENWYISGNEISTMNGVIANSDGDLFVYGSRYFDGWTVADALDNLRGRIGTGGCDDSCDDICSTECGCDGDCDEELKCDIES